MTTTDNRLVVLGDSIAFFEGNTPRLFTSAVLFPAQCSATLARVTSEPWSPVVYARRSWSLFSASREVQRRPDVIARLADASAIILALGNVDCLSVASPRGFPMTWIGDIGRDRTPPRSTWRRVRWRLASSSYRAAIVVTRGRFRHTPRRALAKSFSALVKCVREANPTAPLFCTLPPRGRPELFGSTDRHQPAVHRELSELAAQHGVPTIDLAHLLLDWGGVVEDGVHWPADLHAIVGQAMADAISEALRPWHEEPSYPEAG